MTYKGHNTGLVYDKDTETWSLNNTPTEYVDTEAFSSTDPDFVYVPVEEDDEDEQDNSTDCPPGYIYDETLKQCVPDSPFYQQPDNSLEASNQKDDYAYAITDPNNKSTNPLGIWVPPELSADGTWKAGYTKQMPNTMNKFTQEQLVEWGKSKGYITKSGTIVGAMQASDKLGTYKGVGQFLNDRQYNNWLKMAETEGMVKSEPGPLGYSNKKVKLNLGQEFGSLRMITQAKLNAFKNVASNSIKNIHTNANYDLQDHIRQKDIIKTNIEEEKLKQEKIKTQEAIAKNKYNQQDFSNRGNRETFEDFPLDPNTFDDSRGSYGREDRDKPPSPVKPVKDKGYQSQTRGRKSTPVKKTKTKTTTKPKKSFNIHG